MGEVSFVKLPLDERQWTLLTISFHCSSNGLVPLRQQAITLDNFDLIYDATWHYQAVFS